jgi:hypothetical protein
VTVVGFPSLSVAVAVSQYIRRFPEGNGSARNLTTRR